MISGSTIVGKVSLNRHDHGARERFSKSIILRVLETEGEAEIFNALLKYRRVSKFYYPRDKYGRRV